MYGFSKFFLLGLFSILMKSLVRVCKDALLGADHLGLGSPFFIKGSFSKIKLWFRFDSKQHLFVMVRASKRLSCLSLMNVIESNLNIVLEVNLHSSKLASCLNPEIHWKFTFIHMKFWRATINKGKLLYFFHGFTLVSPFASKLITNYFITEGKYFWSRNLHNESNAFLILARVSVPSLQCF